MFLQYLKKLEIKMIISQLKVLCMLVIHTTNQTKFHENLLVALVLSSL